MDQKQQIDKIGSVLGRPTIINKKEITYKMKAQAIVRWAEEACKVNFDSSFAEKMAEKDDELTDKQKRAIDNIIDGFDINIEEYV